MMVAWDVCVDGWASAIVFAETAPKAKWLAVRSYWDAGYGEKGSWPACGTKREPRFDKHSKCVAPGGPYCRPYIEDTL